MNDNLSPMARIAAIAALAMLSACGKMGELQPQSGSSGVAAAYGQEKPDNPSELLEPSVQARPGRSVELLRRSQRREEDEFDLPPGAEGKASKISTAGDNIAAQPQADTPKEPKE